jgi:hypothetical protein
MSKPKSIASEQSQSSYMSSKRREKLENIKKREELKGLLINKFKSKYASKNVPSSILSQEVNEFLNSEALTEQNLQKLDKKIEDRTNTKAAPAIAPRKPESSKHSHMEKAQKPKPLAQKQKDVEESMRSVHSPKSSIYSVASSGMSGVTELSRIEGDRIAKKKANVKPPSVVSSQLLDEQGEEFENQDDEWVAIMKFNKEVHEEELNQIQRKKVEQKKYLSHELSRQVKEKKHMKEREKNEQNEYFNRQMMHLEYLEKQEQEKIRKKKDAIMQQKESRDRQTQQESKRKRVEDQMKKKEDQDLGKLSLILLFHLKYS